eukprot:UN07644
MDEKTQNENGEEEWVQSTSPETLDDWYDSVYVDTIDVDHYLTIGSGEGFDDAGGCDGGYAGGDGGH